jgi:subtilisin family serine protease
MLVWIKRGFLSLAILGLLAAAPAQAQKGPPVDVGMADEMRPVEPGGAVPGQYIIVFQEDVLNVRGVAAEMARAHGLGIRFIYTNALRGFAAQVPEGRLHALERDPRVDYVEQDQWGGIEHHGTGVNRVNPVVGIMRVNADMNANIDIDGVDDLRVHVDVAVIDTGIDLGHPDLNVVGGINCASGNRFSVSCSGDGDAGHWHGTHVAGTIAALDDGHDVTLDGGTDVVGVAPGARLWAVRVLDNRGAGTAAQYIAGVDWVIANGAIEVANSSLGYPHSDAICDAVARLAEAGVTHTVSAGNDSSLVFKSPGDCPDGVITVSAMADYDGLPDGIALGPNCSHGDGDADDSLADFSNYGPEVDVTAPGVCVVSTYPNGYAWASGTSMSAPHVAGAAALLAASGMTDPVAIESTLENTGHTDWDVEESYTEPLIDVSNVLVFNPVMLAAGEEPVSPNASPSAQFSRSCTDLTCDFTDQSSDSDGSVVDWDWNFGDGTTISGVQNPSHTYVAYGEYTVTLTAWDDDNDSGQTSQTFMLSAPAEGGDITLTASLQGKVHKRTGLQKVRLEWTGATGADVDVERDGVVIATTANDGTYTESVDPDGSYVYRVCEAGTSTCSNTAPMP